MATIPNMLRASHPSVGRVRERAVLSDAADTKRAALVALYGRRRVGKTHLVRTHLGHLAGTYFEAVGEHAAPKTVQLDGFRRQLEATFFPQGLPTLRDWRQALRLLGDGVEATAKRAGNRPIVVFFDELPWMSTHRSGLLPAIDHLWNARLSKVPNLVWVLCGSAASFMLDHLINAKGGLHNRVTHRIRLDPFRLGEARELLASRGLRRGVMQTLELYMALGGVPQYLLQVPRGASAPQAIGEICFGPSGYLTDEFDRLFASLFDESKEHIALVRAAARTRGGATRGELMRSAKIASGGRLSRRLDELEAASFLARYVPYGKKSREATYRLIDEFSLFHLKWIDGMSRSSLNTRGGKYWLAKANTPGYRSWAGYAFEGVCLEHSAQIEAALGIDGMANEVGTWHYRPKPGSRDSGAQIDLLFDRPDGVINVCEIKYAQEEFRLTKSYAKELVNKVDVFKHRTKTKKEVVLTLVTTYGLRPGLWNDEVIENVVTADALMH